MGWQLHRSEEPQILHRIPGRVAYHVHLDALWLRNVLH